MDDFVDDHHTRRASDPVVVTTRDIYDLALETKTTVDTVLALQQHAATGHADHETRLRALETRYFGIVGALGLGAVSVIGTFSLLVFQIVRTQ